MSLKENLTKSPWGAANTSYEPFDAVPDVFHPLHHVRGGRLKVDGAAVVLQGVVILKAQHFLTNAVQ